MTAFSLLIYWIMSHIFNVINALTYHSQGLSQGELIFVPKYISTHALIGLNLTTVGTIRTKLEYMWLDIFNALFCLILSKLNSSILMDLFVVESVLR